MVVKNNTWRRSSSRDNNALMNWMSVLEVFIGALFAFIFGLIGQWLLIRRQERFQLELIGRQETFEQWLTKQQQEFNEAMDKARSAEERALLGRKFANDRAIAMENRNHLSRENTQNRLRSR